MAFWLDIAAFALKALLIVAAVGAVAVIVALMARGSRGERQDLEIKSLDDRYDDDEAQIRSEILDKKGRKAFIKSRKAEKKATPPDKRVFVLRFKGDIGASAVGRLGREVDTVLSVARPGVDEVVTRLESPGGTVTGYGLAASQLRRVTER